jgi:hypothetical protein
LSLLARASSAFARAAHEASWRAAAFCPLIIDRDFPLLDESGAVGVAVIDRSRTVFDDIVIESLE